ncbi:MAG: DUF4129 domain-containing protein [Lachnospiraceae bacterium]|nr:DUF4129 domain-containing protein [Lachnospiraceae bacterium]
MNIKRIEHINELLTEQMNHWLLFPLPLTVMGVANKLLEIGEPGLLMWALCGLIPPLFFVFRCKIRNLILFLLAHLGTAVLVFAISGQSILTRILCTVCVTGYLLQSLMLRVKHDKVYTDSIHLAFAVILSAATALFQYYQGTRGWENYYNVSLIAGISLYFIIYFTDHYLHFLSMNQSSAGYLPAGEMFHSGMGLVFCYTLLGLGILIFSTQFEWLAGILKPLGKMLREILRFLLSGSSQPEAVPEPVAEEAMPSGGMGMNLPPANEPFWFWQVLEVLAMVAFGAGIIIGIGVLLWKLFKLIQKYMVFRYREREVDIGEAYDLREKCEIDKVSDKKGWNPFSALSPRERIRKLYKKKLAAFAPRANVQDKDSLGLYTAREWEGKLSLSGMADIYEQARYSDREMTGADVKQMKELWK